jgi:O-acetyl-ADP-ribose deacetylase (regulator of RNase III)
MISYTVGDLVEAGLRGEVDIIIHQANLEHTFGAGIARQIREKLPYAYEADVKDSIKGSKDKLGWYTVGMPPNEVLPVVINLYSQPTLYPSHTSYDAMFEGLSLLARDLPPNNKVGIPYQMGCGLADGNWEIVKEIIKQAFIDSPLEIIIYKLPDTPSRNF